MTSTNIYQQQFQGLWSKIDLGFNQSNGIDQSESCSTLSVKDIARFNTILVPDVDDLDKDELKVFSFIDAICFRSENWKAPITIKTLGKLLGDDRRANKAVKSLIGKDYLARVEEYVRGKSGYVYAIKKKGIKAKKVWKRIKINDRLPSPATINKKARINIQDIRRGLSGNENQILDNMLRVTLDGKVKSLSFESETRQNAYNMSIRRILEKRFSVSTSNEGRIYHTFSNVKKEIRPYILIDGEETIEPDIQSMHPYLLLGIAPIPADEKKKLKRLIESDFYSIFYSRTELTRNESKILFNTFLNGGRKKTKLIKSIMKLEFPELTDWILDQRKTLGLKLQKLESSVFIDQMCEHCSAEDIPFIPIHDSVIVKKNPETILSIVQFLMKSFNKLTGSYPVVTMGSTLFKINASKKLIMTQKQTIEEQHSEIVPQDKIDPKVKDMIMELILTHHIDIDFSKINVTWHQLAKSVSADILADTPRQGIYMSDGIWIDPYGKLFDH